MSDTRTDKGLSHWLKTNQGVGVMITILATLLFVYLWNHDWFHRTQRDGFTLGFFPGLGVAAIIVCSLALVVDKVRHVVVEEMRDVGWHDLKWCLTFCIGGFVLYFLMSLVGLPLASTLFLFTMMTLLGMRPWHTVLGIAFGVSVAITVVFVLLGIRLPGGVIPFVM